MNGAKVQPLLLGAEVKIVWTYNETGCSAAVLRNCECEHEVLHSDCFNLMKKQS